MSNELDILKNSDYFQNLDQEAIENFYKISEKQTFIEGDVIYVEQSENDKIFFVIEGSVQGETKLSDSGITIDFKAGSFFGIESMFDDGSPQASITTTALSDVCMLTWTASQWLLMFTDDPKTGYSIIFAFAKALRDQIKVWNMNVLNSASWGIE